MLVARAFESANIEYFLGGSLASSYHGEPRATNDIDFVVSMTEDHVAALVEALGAEFLVDRPALIEALRAGRSWNLVHLPTVTKVDLIMRGTGDYDEAEFSRRERVQIRPGHALFIKRPEDSVLRKLLWYREGEGVSERQWRDVVGVLRTSGTVMDPDYLQQWAQRLRVQEFLERAQREAAQP